MVRDQVVDPYPTLIFALVNESEGDQDRENKILVHWCCNIPVFNFLAEHHKHLGPLNNQEP